MYIINFVVNAEKIAKRRSTEIHKTCSSLGCLKGLFNFRLKLGRSPTNQGSNNPKTMGK